MKFLTRLGYYLGGFSVGLILLAIFLGGKKTSCSYGPNARTVKNIASKKIEFESAFSEAIQRLNMDSSQVRSFVIGGNVDFNESVIGKNACNVYLIENIINDKSYFLKVENCDSIAYYQNILPK